MHLNVPVINVNTVRCPPHNLFIGSKVKIGYTFQPLRWSSSSVITNATGITNFNF
jgi:hypothetical protein